MITPRQSRAGGPLLVGVLLLLGATACTGAEAAKRAYVPGTDGCPQWSPDSKWIAFDRVWSGWGTQTGGDPALEEQDVVVVDRAGHRPRRLTVTAADEYVLGWRDSPPRVIFERVPAGTGHWRHFTSDALRVAHSVLSAVPDGPGRVRRIADLPKAATIVSLSPNGRLLLTGFDSDDADNRFIEYRVGRIGRSATPILPHGTIARWARWSPDSTRIDYRPPNEGMPVSVVVDPGGRVLRRTSAIPGAYHSVGERSPDGRLNASNVRGALHDYLVVSRYDGSNRRRVGRAGGVDPTWSRDSRRLYYAWNGEVRVVAADGSGDRRVAQVGAGVGCLAVSPDGDRLAFLRTTKLPNTGIVALVDTQLVVMDADGRGRHAVPPAAKR